jgi:hypothetical protein
MELADVGQRLGQDFGLVAGGDGRKGGHGASGLGWMRKLCSKRQA